MTDQLTIEEWQAEHLAKLDRYVQYFKEGQTDHPEVFPLSLPSVGEWEEDFSIFET